MPYKIYPNGDGSYKVINTINKKVHSHFTTLSKAKKQISLLHMIDDMKGRGILCGCGLNVNVVLSEESYKEPEKREHEVHGYIYNPDHSNNKTAVYINPQERKIVISHRGTNPKDKNDIKNDALLIFGQLDKSQRFKNSLKIAKDLQNTYKDYQIINVGHSLGGKYAAEIAKRLKFSNSHAETFNQGESPFEIPLNLFNKLKCSSSNSGECKKLRNQIINTTGVDPISISSLSSVGDVRITKPSSLNVHSLSNF